MRRTLETGRAGRWRADDFRQVPVIPPVRRLVGAIFLLAAGSRARAEDLVYKPPACVSGSGEQALLKCYAPVFTIPQGERSYNRIGTPVLRLEGTRERARVDPATPAVFAEMRPDRIGATEVLQLVYRIHFERVPFKPSVFFEVHHNAGLLAIVTLTKSTRQPILFTTVQTCGCFRALLPTDLFPPEGLPAGWPKQKTRIWGKTLPAVVAHPEAGRTRLTIFLDPKTHRVRDIATLPELPEGKRIDLPLSAMADLRALPVEGDAGRTGSFFYTHGSLKGHVRGAWSPIEGIGAGPLLLDFTFGMDKDFGDPAVTGTPLYTSLLPWQRKASRLDRFDRLLRFLKFRLASFESNEAR